jgi:hypothetical protein
MADKQISITRGAGSLLAQVLSMAHWSNDRGEKFRAGEMIEGPLGFAIDAPRDSQPKFDAWALPVETVTMTERQIDVAKKCINGCLANLPCGKHLNSLLTAFGLAPE